MRSEPVRAFKLKYDGSVSRHVEADLVLADEAGWLVTHQNGARHRGWKRGETVAVPPHMVGFFSVAMPYAAWFMFDEAGQLTWSHADAALPAVVRGAELSFVDLDLDVIGAADGSYYVRDLEPFARNAERMAYPAEVRAAAWEGLRMARTDFEARRYPFDGSADRILAALLEGAGPPAS